MNKQQLTLLFIISFCLTYAQGWVEKMQNPKGNYYDIKADFENYWKTRDITEKGKGYKAFRRWEHFVESRVYPSGDLSLLALTPKNYNDFLNQYQASYQGPGKTIGNGNLIASATWTPIGPMGAISGNAGGQLLKSGRLGFITITPGNSNNLWIGAPAGGLWHSTNGGQSWTTNTDFLSIIGCSDLAIDPTNTLTMYLATGDGDAGDTRSIGVLKSTNGGSTWASTGLTNAVTNYFLIRRIIINPSNPQILLAATNSGIYRTTNGGASWTQITTSSTYDLEFKPGNPNVVYAGGSTLSRSTNGGASWTQISNGIPTTGVNRMAIAVTAADTNYVYVLASNSSNSGLQGFYKSVNGGTSFTSSTSTLNLLGYSNAGTDTGGQGWYDLCVAASPLDKNEVVTGGVNVWRTTDGGTTFSLYGHWTGSGAPFTHADQHDLEFDAAGTLFNTNDGTVYKRTGTTWTEISGNINISQIYRLGMSSLTPNKWITGHQDNGTSIWNGSTYSAALGGDGMDCFYDRTNNNNVFGEYQNGGMQRSTNGGISWSSATSGLSGTAPWLTVWKQATQQSSNVLYCGLQNLFVSTNLAASWGTLAPFTATTAIREFAIAPSNSLVIYVLKSSGIYKTTNGGSSWNTVTGTVPVGSGAPEYVCVDPSDPNNAWVVLSGYSNGNKVFVTTNGGTSWVNYSGNLPNIPANCIVYEPGTNDRVYVGMDVGVYYRDNTMSNWVLYNTNLPNVPISELEISPASPTLLHAATYGRGVWVANLYAPGAPPVCNFSVTANSICVSAATTFTDLSTQTPTAWLWSVQPSAGVTISSPTVQNPTITFPSGGTYTVTLLASNAYGSNTFSQLYTVNGLPSIVIIGATPSICPGASIGFTASGASSYTWSNGGGNSATATYSPTSPTVYTVSGSVNGCAASKTVGILFYNLPVPVINGPDTVCVGDQALLTAISANSYTWSTGAVNISSVYVSPTTTSVYTVTATGNGGCKGSASLTVVVNPVPQVTVTSASSLICAGEEITLNAAGALNYVWQPGGATGSTVSYTPNISSTYSCVGTDANNCNNEASITISVSICESLENSLLLNNIRLSLYPNPAKTMVNISREGKTKDQILFELMDATGKVLLSQNLEFGPEEKAEISLASFAGGMYFVRLSAGSKNSRLFKIVNE